MATMKATMKVWVTKYALTDGIQERVVETSHSPSMVSTRVNGYDQYYHGEGKEWHRTEEGAKRRANEMVAAKLKSLRKSLAQYEMLSF